MNIKFNFLFQFIFLIYEIESLPYHNEKNKTKKIKYQINENLSIISTLLIENFSYSINLSLINNNKILDYTKIQTNSEIKSYRFMNSTKYSVIITLVVNDYDKKDFLEFYNITIKQGKFITYEFLYRQPLKNNYVNNYTSYSKGNILYQKKNLIRNLLDCYSDFSINLGNQIEFKTNYSITITDKANLKILKKSNQENIELNKNYTIGTVFLISGDAIGNYQLTYQLKYYYLQDCTTTISIIDFDCPSKDFNFSGNNQVVFNFSEQNYIDKVTFTNIPQKFTINPTNTNKDNNITFSCSDVENEYILNYELKSSNEYIKKACSLVAKKVKVDCPIQSFELMKGYDFFFNFGNQIEYIDKVVFSLSPNGLTISPEITTGSTVNEYSLDTVFRINIDETDTSYSQDYTLKSDDGFVSASCELTLTYKDFVCQTRRKE